MHTIRCVASLLLHENKKHSLQFYPSRGIIIIGFELKLSVEKKIKTFLNYKFCIF